MATQSDVSPGGYGNVLYNDFFVLKTRDVESLFFRRTPTLTPGLENLGLQTQTPTPALKTRLQLWVQNQTPTLGLIV